MDNYDDIAQDLKQTIEDYKLNLTALKDRFADIGNIITHLDQLKLQAQQTESKGEELFANVTKLELKHSELTEKMTVLSTDYDDALIKFKSQHSEWNKAVDGIVIDVTGSIADLRSDYNDKLNKAVAEIAFQAKQEAASLDQFLQQFSNTMLTIIAQSRQELGNSITQSISQNSTQVIDLIRVLESVVGNRLEKIEDIIKPLEQKIYDSESSINQSISTNSMQVMDLIRELGDTVGNHLGKIENCLVKKVEDLHNEIMADLRTTRKINMYGFIVILAFIIGLIIFLV